jgi:hypothetical protein
VKRLIVNIVVLLAIGCSHSRARSTLCFDEICSLVAGKGPAEVEELLGVPDSREALAMSGERWTWWNYTYLSGSNYAPEERGRIVHLEIIFELSGSQTDRLRAPVKLEVGGPLSVSYSMARETMW